MPAFPRRFAPGLAILAGSLLAAAPARAVVGDLTDDLKVTSADAILALRIAGGRSSSTPPMVKTGDVAGGADNAPDGRIDLLDAVRILRAATGLAPFPPPIVSASLSGSLAINGNTTKNWDLPRAYWVRGSVTGPDLGSNPAPTATVALTPRTDAFARVLGPVTGGKYVVPARSGVNDAALELEYLQYGDTGLEMDYLTLVPLQPTSVNVTADATQNFTYAAPPAPGTLTGSINAPDWDIYDLRLNLNNGGWATAVLNDIPADSYSITSAPGTGTLSVEYATDLDDGGTDLIANLSGSPVTVSSGGTGTANITLPALTTLTGTFDGEQGWVETYQTLPGGGSVDAYRNVEDDGTYLLATPSGPGRLVLGTETDGPNGYTSLGYVNAYTVPSGGGTVNFTMPALPVMRSVSGIVRDPVGNPAANVSVTLYTTITSPATFTGWSTVADVTTGPDGSYNVQVPDGTYTVELTPPAPEGPPSGTAASRAQRRRLIRWSPGG